MKFKNVVTASDGKERVSVLVDREDNRGYGFAEAEIERSIEHTHPEKMVEVYVLVEGKLRVHFGSTSKDLMFAGDTVTIPHQMSHWAEQIGQDVARIVVVTVPAWTQENHVVTKK